MAFIPAERSSQVNSVLSLPAPAVDVAISYVGIGIKKVSAEILENVFSQQVERWQFAGSDSGRKIYRLVSELGSVRIRRRVVGHPEAS